MKSRINLLAVLILALFISSSLFAQEQNSQNKKTEKIQTKQQMNTQGPNWIDENGDGICDNYDKNRTGNQYKGSKSKQNKKGKFGDGSGIQPQDGAGFGLKNGSGTCDGSGPSGKMSRKGRQ
jgi:hypothetical protein